MKIRSYTPEDFQTVKACAEARGELVAEEFLGRMGFIAEDESGPCAVAFLYLMFDVPVATVDNLFTRPNQSLKASHAAWRMIWRCIQHTLTNLKDCDGAPLRYKLVRTYCREPLARFLKADNWTVAERNSRQVCYVLPIPS